MSKTIYLAVHTSEKAEKDPALREVRGHLYARESRPSWRRSLERPTQLRMSLWTSIGVHSVADNRRHVDDEFVQSSFERARATLAGSSGPFRVSSPRRSSRMKNDPPLSDFSFARAYRRAFMRQWISGTAASFDFAPFKRAILSRDKSETDCQSFCVPRRTIE